MTEKQKHNLKQAPKQKKALDKKETLKNKKELLTDKKNCKIETKKELTKIDLDILKTGLGHTVKPGENIWRIIYEHSKKQGITPISPKRLENINITPGDKIFFTKEKVIIKYLSGGTNNVLFEEKTNCETEKKELKKTPEIKETSKNEVSVKVIEKDEKINKTTKNKQTKTQESITTEAPQITPKIQTKNEIQQEVKEITIFDKNSPLLGDQKAYINELKIRETYGNKIKNLINTFCIGSIINENFLYGVIARESRFDTNAVSHLGVKGLGQLTKDTVDTIYDINFAKTSINPSLKELRITNELLNKNGKIDEKKSLLPLNQIKLTISYLLYLEEIFKDIQDYNFKTELIITSYNLGPNKTKQILEKYENIKNWEGLKDALYKEVKKGKIKPEKVEEVVNYVPIVKKYILANANNNNKNRA